MEILSWKLTLFSIAFALRADNRVVCLNKTKVNATYSVDNTTEVVNVVDVEQSREAVLGMSSICSSVYSRCRDAIVLTLIVSQTSSVICLVACLLKVAFWLVLETSLCYLSIITAWKHGIKILTIVKEVCYYCEWWSNYNRYSEIMKHRLITVSSQEIMRWFHID